MIALRTILVQAFRVTLISLCIALSGCSTNLLKSSNFGFYQEETENSNIANNQTPSSEMADFNFEQDTMYDLLVAEVAAQRGQFNVTVLNYIQQARITRDPGVIKRAINAAQFNKDVEAIQEMAILWVEVVPDSIPAHQLLAFQYSLQKRYAQAVLHMDKLIQLGGDARVESLAIGSRPLPNEDKTELLALYKNLYEKHPTNNEVAYSLALIHRNLKQYNEGLAILAAVIIRSPTFQPAVVLKLNLLYDNDELKTAIEYAEDKYDDYPENHTLGRLYASMLIEDKQLDLAEDIFKDLVKLYPDAPGLKLSLALVALENNRIETARDGLLELLNKGIHINEANFYLGRIADNEKDYATAIQYYSLVKRGAQFDAALERSSFLLTKEDRTDEALSRFDTMRENNPEISLKLWVLQYKLLSSIKDDRSWETLNEAIDAFPANEPLRYARAMTHEERGDLQAMEADLRTIIKNNPKHAVAINALGYTLADRTDRLKEAFSLIQLALSLKPENPAILDSMGWVLYRLDKKEEALVLLLKAFQNYPDAEVAAHLGEVLWAIGKQNDARTIWQAVLQKSPEHKVLLKTINRFEPSLLLPSEPGSSESEKDTPSESKSSSGI